MRTSYGKVIGGFISNYLIEEEKREDRHAFIFSLEDGVKCKIREEYR
jgi:hypothetical protein